ncbi:PREDICTED: uncharacterized protein LOC105364307 isoform X2 [Ceratosolen solmsi marchali]|uniref:Uncharacterized protein LOC105364307 isoform X2 n=1 Tax=Ceratosolen solmsi marchali TaxID=326594 RepID=A0AAJ7DXX9_9HYME|nr:PREDICTED: uncharacterized protein LOC105364307 isoform X2 [Ceratosolen solmsi marchali]
MKASLSLALLLVAVLGTAASHRHPELRTNEIDHEIESEPKLLVDCQHSDYRAYIKCLKREKRQHHGSGFGNTRVCLDECFEQNCTNATCLRECHSHCRKRLVETYSKTVETSFDCANGECAETRGSNSPNITTIVNITNLVPNATSCADAELNCHKHCNQGDGKCGANDESKCSHGDTKCGRDDGDRSEEKRKPEALPKIDINNVINNQFGPGFYPGADCACPGCNCYAYNPWQSSPQITIGIGGGPIGGCIYPMPWPCFQRFPTPAIDCAVCNNPFLRYRCDPSCAQDPRRNYTQSTMGPPLTSTPSYKWMKKQQ